jgi:hypothetical protein
MNRQSTVDVGSSIECYLGRLEVAINYRKAERVLNFGAIGVCEQRRQRCHVTERGGDKRACRLTAFEQDAQSFALPVSGGNQDRLAARDSASVEQQTHERTRRPVLGDFSARHEKFQCVVQIALFDAVLEHDARNVNDIRRKSLDQRRVVRDVPEEFGIAKIIVALRLSERFGPHIATLQQIGVHVEQPRERRDVAGVNCANGLAENGIDDRLPIEQCNDGGAIGSAAEKSALERGAAFGIELPGQRIAGDENLDEFERAAARRSVQRQIPFVAESRAYTVDEQLSHAVDVCGPNGREKGARRVVAAVFARDFAHEFGPISEAITTRQPSLSQSEWYRLFARQPFCFFSQVFGGGANRKMRHGGPFL